MSLFPNIPDLIWIAVAVLVIVAAILILCSGRRDDDVGGTRSRTRYIGTIEIVTLFVALLAFYQVVRALTTFIVDGHDDNSLYRDALNSGLVMITAGAVFLYHARLSNSLVGRGLRGASVAVVRVTHYGVCFVAAVIALLAAAKAVYGLFQIIAPGVFGGGSQSGAGFGSGGFTFDGMELPPALQDVIGQGGFGGADGDVARQQGISDLLSWGTLAFASVVIFLRSWNGVPDNR